MKIRIPRKQLGYAGCVLLAGLALPVWAGPASNAAPATGNQQAGSGLPASPAASRSASPKILPYGAGFEQRQAQQEQQRRWPWATVPAGGTSTGAASTGKPAGASAGNSSGNSGSSGAGDGSGGQGSGSSGQSGK